MSNENKNTLEEYIAPAKSAAEIRAERAAAAAAKAKAEAEAKAKAEAEARAKEEAEQALSEFFSENPTDYQLTEADEESVNIRIPAAEADTKALCRDLFFLFAGKNLPITEMTTERASLEKVFVELTEQSAESEVSAS